MYDIFQFSVFFRAFQLDQPVSAGSRGLNYFLNGIDDELRQLHRSRLFSVEAPALRSVAEKLHQLSTDPKVNSGCTVLGPEESFASITKDGHASSSDKWDVVRLME